MKDSVSSQKLRSVLALFAALSVVWIACSIFVPWGFPWMGLAWVGSALAAALFVSIRATREVPMAELLRDFEVEPIPVVAANRVQGSKSLSAPLWILLAGLSCSPASLFARTSDPANLSACQNGGSSCKRSRLTLLEMTEVGLAARARNVSSCGAGLSRCNQKQLNRAEALVVAGALYDRNVSNCQNGFSPCDRSRLTPSEAAGLPSEIR